MMVFDLCPESPHAAAGAEGDHLNADMARRVLKLAALTPTRARPECP